MILSLVGASFQSALAQEPAVEDGRAIKTEAGRAEAHIKKLQAHIEKEPDNQPALEELALAHYQNGDYSNADLTYTRLLKFNLNNPALALPYAMNKWHLRQEYEAQASMIRSLKVKMSPGNVKQLQTTLAECFDPEVLAEAFKPEFPNAEDLAALERLNTLMRETVAETRRLEAARNEAGLTEFISRRFGPRNSAGSFYALWRFFALIHKNDLDGAEMMLRLARPARRDSRLEADILTAANLLADLRKEPDSGELRKAVTDLLSDAASAIGVSRPEAEANVSAQLNEAKQLLDQRRFSEAAVTLDRVRPFLAKNEDKILYLYFHAEALWPLTEYTRANQAYVASSVLLRDRYFISTAIFRMGEYAAMQQKREEAAQYAIRSAGILREDSWVLRRTGLFFMNIDMTERGLVYLERALERSDTLQSDADSYSALADAYKRLNDRDKYIEYARRYVDTINRIIAQNGDYTDQQRGLAAFYQGEILFSEEKFKEAYASYEAASQLVTEPYRLADIYIIMAEYQATAGNIDQAETLAVKSADLLPGDVWKARQVGGLLVRLGKRSKANLYLEKALELSFSVQERAYSTAALADACLAWREIPRFLDYADEYTALVKMHRDQFTEAQEGLAAFFQGEIYHYQGDGRRAYQQYEQATKLLDDRFKRSEAWMRMADIKAVAGEMEEAAALADKSADELRDQGWKMRLVGNFFMRFGLYGKAEDYYQRYVRMSAPDDPLLYHSILADAYKDANRQEPYIRAAGEYIKAATAGGRAPTGEEAGLMAYYQGEIDFYRHETEKANEAYERAAPLLTDKKRRAEALMRLARFQAEQGNAENAAELAVKAGETFPEADTLRQAGALLVELGQADKVYALFERYAEDVSGRQNMAEIYSAMADFYDGSGDRAKYLFFASEYVKSISAEVKPSESEKGLMAYYRGELAAEGQDAGQAYARYEEALSHLTDQSLLSKIYEKMAKIESGRGNQANAGRLAEKSAQMKAEANKEELERVTGALRIRTSSGEESYYQRAEGLAAANKHNEASSENQRSIRPNSDRPHVPGGTLMEKARILAGKRKDAAAIELMKKAAARAPGDSRLLIDVGDLYKQLGRGDEALEYYRRGLQAAQRPSDRAFALSTIALTYRERKNWPEYLTYAKQFVQLASSGKIPLSQEMKALSLFHQGEILSQEDDYDRALSMAEQSVDLFSNDYIKFEALLLLADINAKIGNMAEVTKYAVQAGELLPNDPWQQRKVGEFFAGLNQMDEALTYYRRFLALGKDGHDRAMGYATLAGAYQRMGRQEKYIENAKLYLETVSSLGDEATDDQKGNWGYYYGEIMTAEKKPEEAYKGYSTAVKYLRDKYRLSETYGKMARHNAKIGNRDLAREQALKAAELMPGEYWRVKDAVDILIDLKEYDLAIEVIDKAPANESDFYLLRSVVYQRADKRPEAIEASKDYIDSLRAGLVNLSPRSVGDGELKLWEARRRHGELTRLLPGMSMEIIYGGMNYRGDNYYNYMSAEFNRYFYVNSFFKGSVYTILNGDTSGYLSGTYMDQDGNSQIWENNPSWKDSRRLRLGLRINPLDGWLESLSFKAEQVFGLGRLQENDFRFIVNFDRGSDDRPRLTDKSWPYWKIWMDAPYSTRNNDLTSFGSFKGGVTVPAPWDRNFIINAYGMGTYSYLGKEVDSSSRWGSEAGIGIDLKKFLGETKYRTAMESVEFSVYHLWRLTDSRQDGLGFTFTVKF